jgi:hypothetical protein
MFISHGRLKFNCDQITILCAPVAAARGAAAAFGSEIDSKNKKPRQQKHRPEDLGFLINVYKISWCHQIKMEELWWQNRGPLTSLRRRSKIYNLVRRKFPKQAPKQNYSSMQ